MNNQNQSNRPANRPTGGRNFKNNRRRYRGHQNRNRPVGPEASINRLVEKYINLLDQHLIARRKFHDLYYRAEPQQLNKLERNFYSTLNDLRDFEAKLPPETKELFEKRVNGLRPDVTYSTNHQLNPTENVSIDETHIEDPHLLASQKKASYKDDTEESMGSLEDYNKYKML